MTTLDAQQIQQKRHLLTVPRRDGGIKAVRVIYNHTGCYNLLYQTLSKFYICFVFCISLKEKLSEDLNKIRFNSKSK